MRNRDRQQRSAGSQGNDECQEGNQLCAPSMLKVLDFSADNEEGEKPLMRNRDRQQRSVISQSNLECQDG